MRAMELFSVRHMLIFVILPLLPIAAIFLYFHHRAQSNNKTSSSTALKLYPLLGHLPHFIRNRHRFLEWTSAVMAEAPTHTMCFLTPISNSGVITANPSNVEHILKTNSSNYPKGQKTINDLHDFLGDGIFNSDDEQWRWQRKVASLEFSTRSLRSFVMDTVQQEIASRLLPLLSRAAADEGRAGSIVDLEDVLERFGFDNICMVSFGEDPGSLTEEKMTAADQPGAPDFMRSFGEAQNLLTVRLMAPSPWIWVIKKLLNIGTEKQLREVISTVHDYADSMIRTRNASLVRRDDLLSRVAAANKDITHKQLRDIVISFLLAGRETTSSALTWFFWVLSTKPDVERRILEEIRSARKEKPPSDEAAGFSYEELREMQYLHAALTESMRLYPPVPVDTVSCRNGDVLPDGTSVGKGWFVSYSAYAMGRLKSIWGADWREYRPERWLDEEEAFRAESPFRYPVFHAGPRACLGKEMAYLQMKSIAACVLERFEIEVVGKGEEEPEHVLSFTLRMKGGLPVRVKERRSDGAT